MLGGEPVGTMSFLRERSLRSFGPFGLLPQIGTGSSELVADLVDLLPGRRCLVASVVSDIDVGWFLVASLTGAEGTDTIGVGGPLSWPATLARNGHELTVTERNDSCTNRVIVCEVAHIASDERSSERVSTDAGGGSIVDFGGQIRVPSTGTSGTRWHG